MILQKLTWTIPSDKLVEEIPNLKDKRYLIKLKKKEKPMHLQFKLELSLVYKQDACNRYPARKKKLNSQLLVRLLPQYSMQPTSGSRLLMAAIRNSGTYSSDIEIQLF